MTFYKIKPISDNKIEIKIIEKKINNSDKLIYSDSDLVIDGYNILFEIYRCKLSKDFIQNNKKYPLYYISIIYNKSIIIGSLFYYFLMFEYDENNNGKFYYSLKNDENSDGIRNAYKYKSKKDIIKDLINFKNDIKFIELITEQLEIKNKNRSKFNDIFSYTPNTKIINIKSIQNNPSLLDNY